MPQMGHGASALDTALPPRYLGAVFVSAGHLPVFSVRRGKEEFLLAGRQLHQASSKQELRLKYCHQ